MTGQDTSNRKSSPCRLQQWLLLGNILCCQHCTGHACAQPPGNGGIQPPCRRESRSRSWCCTISQPQGNRSRTSHFLKRGSVGSGRGSRTISRNSRASRRSQWLAPSQNPFRLISTTSRRIKAPPDTKATSTSEPVGKVGNSEKPPFTLFRLNRIHSHRSEERRV